MGWARPAIMWIASALLATAGMWADLAIAQDRTERISFAPGQDGKTVTGTVSGYDGVSYLVDVRRGQRLAVRFETSNASNYFNILPPGGGEAIFIGSTSGGSARVTSRQNGDHRIQVYLMRNAARRSERARYRLSVIVIGRGSSESTTPDDDGFTGGPDFWEVANVPPGDRLNVRTAPSAQADVVARLRNGVTLRNLGCSLNGQTRWCRVERRDGNDRGWAAGRFLVEYGG